MQMSSGAWTCKGPLITAIVPFVLVISAEKRVPGSCVGRCMTLEMILWQEMMLGDMCLGDVVLCPSCVSLGGASPFEDVAG